MTCTTLTTSVTCITITYTKDMYICQLLLVFIEMANNRLTLLSKRIIAHDVVTVRGAIAGDNPPLIISIPAPIVRAVKYKKGEKLQIYTDGERTYLDRLAEPKI